MAYKTPKSELITFKVDKLEQATINLNALKKGVSKSAYVRSLIFKNQL